MRWLALALCGACTTPVDVHFATTTTVEASGLLARIEPVMRKTSGMRVRIIIAGTGQALRLLERGDVDAALTHAPRLEIRLVERGLAKRAPLMQNDFLLVGPPKDPAKIRGASFQVALERISAGGHPFVSRGDESGTHQAEKELWAGAGAKAQRHSAYRETGQGMGETLIIASELGAYTLVDAGTLASFGRRVALEPLVRNLPRRNLYSVLWRNENGGRLAQWLQSPEARALMSPEFEPVR